MVCEVEQAPSALGHSKLWYVKRAIWQVESEFEKNSRAALVDFSKFMVGSAPNKLFVAPITHDLGAFRNALIPVAQCCTGRVAAHVPHPEDFMKVLNTEVHVFERGDWRPCDNELVHEG